MKKLGFGPGGGINEKDHSDLQSKETVGIDSVLSNEDIY